MEISVLLPVTLQKELLQVRFLGISRTNTLLRCIQTPTSKIEVIAKITPITRGGRGEVSPALIQKLEKSALILEKKCPNCGHLWVKFLS